MLTRVARCGDNVYMTTSTEATPTERQALTEMAKLMSEARGDHEALAAVRCQIVTEMDALCGVLRSAGVDVDALLDEIDAVLG